eukprot:CAMPEP_0185604966 /NCGR_PEP_ID=MMETSP0436-20130131/3693_1 /TAXON_ID=626734 ORGANISM="Favella taraikaensis, Strain Fe Narragansett Bay" /NCGR_SAMPLE_ID=MMETSP0436 /ASSEMBLY_ACC=CAM_ASM_000390 /LENGTH=174 /DNA_ID=CAMNT_0028235999 /DNA_START=444 /DNA_END=968 /DNA_ORIENTATION=+
MMFIKGTLDAPRCKFTRRLVGHVMERGYRNIKTFDILGDERIRQWLKFYTQWPTFPQVYVEGEFQGGLDVVTELMESGDFDDVVPALVPQTLAEGLAAGFLQLNKVIVFVSDADQASTECLVAHFKALSVTYARVDLSINAEFREALQASAAEFAYQGDQITQVYFNGVRKGSA